MPAGTSDINEQRGGCANGQCLATAVRAGSGGLGAFFELTQAGTTQWENGGASAWADGEIQIIPPTPGGPSFIETVLHLHISGVIDGSAIGAAIASGGLGISASLNEAGVGYLKEYWGANTTPPPNEGSHMQRSGPDQAFVTLTLPVGVPFYLGLKLEAFGAVIGGGGSSSVRADFMSTLTLAPAGPLFDLPAGYSATSADWNVDGNRWCPSGCVAPAIPEPSTWVLALLGLGALVGMRRRRRAG